MIRKKRNRNHRASKTIRIETVLLDDGRNWIQKRNERRKHQTEKRNETVSNTKTKALSKRNVKTKRKRDAETTMVIESQTTQNENETNWLSILKRNGCQCKNPG